MQISGKLIEHIRHPEPRGDEGIIELPEVNQENIEAGDTIWVEKIVSSFEPVPQFLSRHPKVVAHFPFLQKDKKECPKNIIDNFLQTALIWCNTCQTSHPIVKHFPNNIEIITALTKIMEEGRKGQDDKI